MEDFSKSPRVGPVRFSLKKICHTRSQVSHDSETSHLFGRGTACSRNGLRPTDSFAKPITEGFNNHDLELDPVDDDYRYHHVYCHRYCRLDKRAETSAL